MTAKDFHALVSVGETVRITSGGEEITGRVLLILDNTIQLLRTDTGTKRAIAIDSIIAVDFVDEPAAPAMQAPAARPEEMETPAPATEPAPEMAPAAPAPEPQGDAPKGNQPAAPGAEEASPAPIERAPAAEGALPDAPAARPAAETPAPAAEAVAPEMAPAAATAAPAPEPKGAAAKAALPAVPGTEEKTPASPAPAAKGAPPMPAPTAAGKAAGAPAAAPSPSKATYGGRIILFVPRRNDTLSYGIIQSTSSKSRFFFRLSKVDDPALWQELSAAKMLRKMWRVNFTLATTDLDRQEATHLSLIPADADILARMEAPKVERGTLKDSNTLITGDGKECHFRLSNVRDAYLEQFLKDVKQAKAEALPPFELGYLPMPGDPTNACVVWPVEAVEKQLAGQYADRFSEKVVQRAKLQNRELNCPANIAGQSPLTEEEKAEREKNGTTADKNGPEPGARKLTTLEEESKELAKLLRKAEKRFANFQHIETSPEDDLCQLGKEARSAGNVAKAEKYLYKALVNDINPQEAITTLASAYLHAANRQDAQEQVARGLYLVDRYKDLFTEERYEICRINLLEKGGFDMLLVEELDKALQAILRPSTRMHYCSRAGHILFRREKYEQALQHFLRWVEIREQYADVLGAAEGLDNKYAVAEKEVNQYLAMCYNMTGEPEQARKIAKKLLQEDAGNAVAKKIMAGTFDTAAAQEAGGADDDGYDYIDKGNKEISQYAHYCLDNAEMQPTRRDVLPLQGTIQGNDYTGTPEQAKYDVNAVTRENFLRRFTVAQRRGYWAMAAKIIAQTMQSYREENRRLRENYLNPSRVWEKIAHSMLSGGDEIMLSLTGDIDSARFLYMESIPLLLGKNDDREKAFVRMIATAMMTRSEMRELTDSNVLDSLSKILEMLKTWSDPELAVDLLLFTFLLDEQDCVRIWTSNAEVIRSENLMSRLHHGIYANQCLREKAEEIFAGMGVVASGQRDSEDAFIANWRSAKEIYTQKREDLIACLHRSVEDIGHPQKLQEDIDFIDACCRDEMAFKLDKERMYSFCRRVLDPLIHVSGKDTFERKRQEYEDVRRACERLLTATYANPTKISFDELIGVLESITGSVEKALDDLYQRSAPELTLELTTNTAYVDASHPYTNVEIAIRNLVNRQPASFDTGDADSLEVTVIGGTGHAEPIQGKLRGEVRGGEQVAREWQVELSPEHLREHYFDIEVKLTYGYFSRPRQEETRTKTARFNISLASADEFEEITNRYSAIREGNGVEDNEMFYGRDEYIQNLVASLQDTGGNMICRRGIVLYGQKRAGKTAILNHLTASIRQVYGPDTYLIVRMGSVGETGDLIGFFSTLMDRFELTLMSDHPQLYEKFVQSGISFCVDEIEAQQTPERARAVFSKAFRRIDRLLQDLGGTQKYIPLFLLDEFTYFYDWIVSGKVSPDFMLFWKAFHQEYRICTISVAMDSMPEFMNYTPEDAAGSFTNSFACLRLDPVGYLERDALKALADQPTRLRNGQSRFQEEALDYLYELTAGSAYLAVILCDELVKYVNENKTVRISPTVIDLVLQKRLFAGNALKEGNFDPQLNDPGVFGADGRAVLQDNKTILTYIARNCDRKGYEISRREFAGCLPLLSRQEEAWMDRLLQRLKNRDVLECRVSNDIESYRIKVDLLRQWLLYKNGTEE